MKKAIKKYLTQLHENEEKGFSLVELIIVMAIMAILVGVVASQVIPYMEKSRQSKDQQVISALLTDITSSIAMSGEKCTGGTAELGDLATVTNAKTVSELMGLRPASGGGTQTISTLYTQLKGQLKSKAFNGKKIKVEVDATSGKTTVFIGDSIDTTNSKSFVTSEESSSSGS